MKLKFEIRPCSEMLDGVWYVAQRYRFNGVDFVGYCSFSEPTVIYCDMEVFSNGEN